MGGKPLPISLAMNIRSEEGQGYNAEGTNSSWPVWEFSCGRYKAMLSIFDAVCAAAAAVAVAVAEDDDVDCDCASSTGGGGGYDMELANNSN